jgi:DNA-binding response OmpR family regulator
MRTTKVLLIESARSSGVSFATSLKRKYQVQIAHSGKQGMALALDKQPDVIVLDAASLRTSGDRICARLRANLDETPIIHIRPADSSPGVSIADVMLVPPFTARKLINRIERFTGPREGKLLKVGSFSLNQEQQTLVTPWSEKKLTPKVVALMELFMHNPNCILERKDIMQKVWKTDYIGDTRTLDVHIRWLRQVVEPNPRKPQYITTVRGKGYRFALPSSDNQTHAGPGSPPRQNLLVPR